MSTPAFGLYSASTMAAGQRVQAGHALPLHEPVDSAGVKLFRRSLWLPVPAGLASAQRLRLAAASLQIRFAPARISVGTDNMAWFPKLQHLSDDDVRLELALPVPVVSVAKVQGQRPRTVQLLRADGDVVADEATVSGVTNDDLPEPFVGSPVVIRLGNAVFDADDRKFIGNLRAGPVSGASAGTAVPVASGTAITYRLASNLVPALTLAGKPTTPRLRLVAEQTGGETLLWQALASGEQGTVVLPLKPLADEWAPALEQLRALCAKPQTTPTRLRLDVESDAPCQVTVAAVSFALRAEIELLSGGPQQFDFSGEQTQSWPMPLALPAGVTPAGLTLAGRVVADAASAAGSTSATARIGALLNTGDVAVQPFDLQAPASLAGFALGWQALSAEARLTLRLHADGGNGPGPTLLAQSTLQLATPHAASLALRWPALDLQPQRLWLKVAVDEGAGLCPFDAAQAAGWIESGPARTALPQGLSATPLPAVQVAPASRAIGLRLGASTVAAQLPADALTLELPAPLLPLLATQTLSFTGGVRGSVTVDSALLQVAL